MDYELIVQLRNAGFPFKEGCSHCGSLDCYGREDELNATLSELIDACVRIRGIRRIEWDENNNEWLAISQCKDEIIGASVGIGKTLEEAVARLWLELRKNRCHCKANPLCKGDC